MGFSQQPLRFLPKLNIELIIALTALLLLLVGLITIAVVQNLPHTRAVPQPVIAEQSRLAGQAGNGTGTAGEQLKGRVSVSNSIPQSTPRATTASITTETETAALTDELTDLLEGPTPAEQQQGQYSEIPAHTQLLGVTQKGNVVTVNLTREFTTGGGSTSIIQRVEELKKAVYKAKGTHNVKVKIAIEGKPLKVLGGEGLELE